LVDAHTHLGWAGQALWQVDWQDARDKATALERVRIAASRIERGLWLLGGGWSRDKLVDAELPALAELDQITGDMPLFLQSEDYSLALANTRALTLFGRDEKWVSPSGGEYEKDPNGILTGRLEGTAARSRAIGTGSAPNFALPRGYLPCTASRKSTTSPPSPISVQPRS
jgi:predicted amidohydrolase YtcJ